MAESTEPKIDEAKLDGIRERQISFNWRGWVKATHEYPVDIYRRVARAVDGVSSKWTAGALALVTMPAALILRNGARAANNTSDLDADNSFAGRAANVVAVLSGVFAAGAGLWYGVPAVYSAVSAATLAAPVIGGSPFVATVAAGTASLISGAMLTIPAYTTGLLTASTAVGTGASVFSALIGLYNIDVAATRSYRHVVQGVRYTPAEIKAMEEHYAKDSLTARHERKQFNAVRNALYYVSTEHKRELVGILKKDEDLKDLFEVAATAQPAVPAAPALEQRVVAKPDQPRPQA